LNKILMCRAVVFLSLLAYFPSLAKAQDSIKSALPDSPLASRSQAKASATASSTSNANAYVFPTGAQRFHNYLWNSFGPLSIAQSAFAAGIGQANNTIPDWGQGMTGFGKRFGTAFGVNVIQNSTQEVVAAALHQDTIYYKCDCKGFGPRFGHALLSGITARASDGHRVFAPEMIGAPYVGTLTALSWFPDRFGPKDSLRLGTWALAGNFATDIAREFFWPFHRH
jgi:hypothetical protein